MKGMKKYMIVLLLGASVGVTAQQTYQLDTPSTLRISGTSTVHDWTLTAHTLEGSLEGDDANLKEVDFTVVVADIKSERGATMDKKMHAALQGDTHPSVRFQLKEVKEAGALFGTLTIAGHEQEAEIKATTEFEGDTVRIAGEHDIALKDFQIEPPTAMFGQVVVGDQVTVIFDLVFQKE